MLERKTFAPHLQKGLIGNAQRAVRVKNQNAERRLFDELAKAFFRKTQLAESRFQGFEFRRAVTLKRENNRADRQKAKRDKPTFLPGRRRDFETENRRIRAHQTVGIDGAHGEFVIARREVGKDDDSFGGRLAPAGVRGIFQTVLKTHLDLPNHQSSSKRAPAAARREAWRRKGKANRAALKKSRK